MSDLISRQAAIDVVNRYDFKYPKYMERFVTELRDAMKADITDDLEDLPSAQPEQKNEELLPDGTLRLFTDADLSKVGRVLVSQNGTHYGALYYADGEPKQGGSEFISWLLDEVWDEELWELNYWAFPELLCRRLARLGYLKEEGGVYALMEQIMSKVSLNLGRKSLHTYLAPSYVEGLIANAPTIQMERKKGKWIRKERERGGFRLYTGIDEQGETHIIQVDERTHGYDLYCSECGMLCSDVSLNFCSNCGADMRGGNNETD